MHYECQCQDPHICTQPEQALSLSGHTCHKRPHIHDKVQPIEESWNEVAFRRVVRVELQARKLHLSAFQTYRILHCMKLVPPMTKTHASGKAHKDGYMHVGIHSSGFPGITTGDTGMSCSSVLERDR